MSDTTETAETNVYKAVSAKDIADIDDQITDSQSADQQSDDQNVTDDDALRKADTKEIKHPQTTPEISPIIPDPPQTTQSDTTSDTTKVFDFLKSQDQALDILTITRETQVAEVIVALTSLHLAGKVSIQKQGNKFKYRANLK